MGRLIQEDQDKIKVFKRYGYDIAKARNFILGKAAPVIGRGKVLEIGTGRGHMALALAKKGIDVVSIDMDKKIQKVARANLKLNKVDHRVTLKIMDAESLKFRDDSFDTVVSVNFLHHAEDLKTCLKEMLRVAGRKVVLADFNKEGEKIMDEIFRLDGKTHPHLGTSFKDISMMLQKAGFRVKTYHGHCQTLIVATRVTT